MAGVEAAMGGDSVGKVSVNPGLVVTSGSSIGEAAGAEAWRRKALTARTEVTSLEVCLEIPLMKVFLNLARIVLCFSLKTINVLRLPKPEIK